MMPECFSRDASHLSHNPLAILTVIRTYPQCDPHTRDPTFARGQWEASIDASSTALSVYTFGAHTVRLPISGPYLPAALPPQPLAQLLARSYTGQSGHYHCLY